jgi:hypothetical protein
VANNPARIREPGQDLGQKTLRPSRSASLPPDYEASDPIGMMHTNQWEYLGPRCAQLAVNF